MAAEFSIHDEASKQRTIAFISALNTEKQKWRVEVKRLVKKRSLSQNALMWKWHGEVVDAVCRDTGNDADDMHEHFKQKFLSPIITEINGEVSKRWSTKNLSTKEMSEFMDRIYAYVSGDLGIRLPLPVEYKRDFR